MGRTSQTENMAVMRIFYNESYTISQKTLKTQIKVHEKHLVNEIPYGVVVEVVVAGERGGVILAATRMTSSRPECRRPGSTVLWHLCVELAKFFFLLSISL